MVPTPGMSDDNLTKAQRTQQRQDKARMLREQERKRAKRNRVLVIIACVAVILVIALVVGKVVMDHRSQAGEAGEFSGKALPVRVQNVGDDYGISVDSKGAATEKKDSALAQIAVYYNATCPHCAFLEDSVGSIIDAHVKDGSAQFTFYPIATDPVNCGAQSLWATTADYYIASYAPEQFLDFHEKIMDGENGVYAQVPESGQYKMCNSDSDPVQPEALARMALDVNVPDDIANSLPASVNSPEWQKVAQQATDAFTQNKEVCAEDSCGTPTITLNGKVVDMAAYGGETGYDSSAFQKWIEEAVKEGK